MRKIKVLTIILRGLICPTKKVCLAASLFRRAGYLNMYTQLLILPFFSQKNRSKKVPVCEAAPVYFQLRRPDLLLLVF
jgi:hypothetical protein